jgi:hypothetical protein
MALAADVDSPAIIMIVPTKVFVPQSFAESLGVYTGLLRHAYSRCRSHLPLLPSNPNDFLKASNAAR